MCLCLQLYLLVVPYKHSTADLSLLPLCLSILLFFSPLPFSCYLDDDPLQPVTSDETVSVGDTVTLTCRVTESDNSSLQWSNTAQQTLYFGEKRGEWGWGAWGAGISGCNKYKYI